MRALNAHPGIVFRGETQFLVPRLWAEVYENCFWYNWQRQERLSPESARVELCTPSETEVNELRERVGRLVADFVVNLLEVPPNAMTWGYKELWNGSAGHCYPWRSFDPTFPRAVWIHLIRNPFDFARSTAQWNQEPLDAGYLKARLEDWLSILLWSRQRQGTGRFLEVRYEHLVQHSRHVLRNVLQHVGHDWSEDCLEAFAHRSLASSPSPFARGAFMEKSELDGLVDEITGLREALNELGYDTPDGIELHVAPERPLPPIPDLSRFDAMPQQSSLALEKILKERDLELARVSEKLADREAELATLVEHQGRSLRTRWSLLVKETLSPVSVRLTRQRRCLLP